MAELQIVKRHSHKNASQLLTTHKPEIINEIETAVNNISAIDCLAKISSEKSKIRKWGGLLFAPRALNFYFKEILLVPCGWLEWNDRTGKYQEPALTFQDDTTISGTDRRRTMDGIKDKVGLEIQFGKYAFMGYDIFSKMIIFNRFGLIDYGIEIVLVQKMIDCMSTGVSAFEHIMIDFIHRGEADIDIPVLVLGIGPTLDEWQKISVIQNTFRSDPDTIIENYPNIRRFQSRGSKPGPK